MSTSKIKEVAMTTAAVLIGIYILNMTPAKSFVQKALNG